MSWPRFTRFLLASALAIGGSVYAFILVMDPYMNVPFSPGLARAPVSTNQRFAYPALARDPAFDSVIIGTSTVRLLDPARLGRLLDARFVNLAMNSATAYEQSRMLGLFVRHHPDAAYVVVGVDETWCNRSTEVARYTFRDFPEWMYDDSRWNDLLYLFNDKALENAVRMAELLAGAREPKYRPDGFRDFAAEFERRGLAPVGERLYAGGRHDVTERRVTPTRARTEWRFTLIEELRAMLAAAPAGARTLVLFPPLHANHVAGRVELFAECKGRVVALADAIDNVEVLDLLHISALTREDARYFDPVHFDREVAARVEDDIARALADAPAAAGRSSQSAQAGAR